MSGDTLETLRTLLSARYRVERLLGSGGMATVYLAQDLKHDRPVAIKVLRPELAVALGPERFLREIQIAAKLNHPHILALHDSGEAGGLLYYVMPYVAGESLQEKVVREKQLSVDEALRITREVCAALAYAHGQGVIHRDIKPANILLSAGYALVADFGLARAISRASSSASITQPWLAVGTPNYMSPEQVSGEEELDGRSDIYSLGCVLYELLAGNPPFSSSNPGSTLLRQRSLPPVPIRSVRASVPGFVEGAISRALAKAPAERFQTAEEFAGALGPAAGRFVSPGTRRMLWPALAVVAVLGIGLAFLKTGNPSNAIAPNVVDTSHYAVLSFDIASPKISELSVEQLVQDALARWKGISLVDRFQVSDMLARQPGPLTTSEAIRIARTLGAGRFVRGELTSLRDSLRIHAVLYDAATRKMLYEGTARVAADLEHADSAVADLVDQLLFRGAVPTVRGDVSVGTTSLPARLAYARGQAGINDWDLARADTAFAEALGLDPDYAQAALWLGLVRAWNGVPSAQWRFATERAAARRDRLSSRDQMLADAALAQSRAAYLDACPAWRRLTKTQPNDFAGWYGLATCLREDPAVVRDHTTASRWRFRTSYQEVVRAYQRAFELLPSVHRAFRSGSYARVQDLLFTSGDRLRPGRAAAPDTTFFLAHPGWAGDTLVFIPYPAHDVSAGRAGTLPTTMQEAVVHQRQLFRDVATAWTAAFPRSADALEALAVSLDLLGDPSALETLRRARLFAQTEDERQRVATAEIWLRLKLSVPGDTVGLREVRALGDSLLSAAGSSGAGDPELLAPVAALLGRVRLAAHLSGRAAELGGTPVPRALARSGQALVTYAAFGGPADTLRNLEDQVKNGIRTGLTSDEQLVARKAWLGRAASLAYPDVTLSSLTPIAGDVNDLLDAQIAAQTRRWAQVRALFDELRVQRRALAPEEIVIDAIYGEARLLILLGDDRGAAQWLDPTLIAVRRAAPQTLALLSGAASLVRAMVLRAEIASRLGDRPGAAKWARPVVVLWAGADGFLQPVVQHMASLTG